MKFNNIILLVLALVVYQTNTYGQIKPLKNIKSIKKSKKYGTPSYIEFYSIEEASVLDHLPPSIKTIITSTANGDHIFNKYIEIPEGNTLEEIFAKKSSVAEHKKFQQWFRGILVEGGGYNVHAKNGYIKLINGTFKPIDSKKRIVAEIKEEAALKAAKSIFKKNSIFDTIHKPELVFKGIDLEGHIGDVVLAYKFRIATIGFDPEGYAVYVDAQSGNVISKNSLIHSCFKVENSESPKFELGNKEACILSAAQGNFSTRYSGSQTSNTDFYNNSNRLRDYSRGSGIETFDAYNVWTYDSQKLTPKFDFSKSVDYQDFDNKWIEYDNSKKDNAALDVHKGTQNTYDYFRKLHGRNSVDNNGLLLKSHVNLYGNILSSIPAENRRFASNAEWNAIDNDMRYYCGDGIWYDALVSQDIVAHELAHGICQFAAGLYYYSESGALNEALSDIWGATVENYYFGSNKSTWLMGEDCDLVDHTGLRNMKNPNLKGHPDTYRGEYWNWNDFDNGGVHINSGVINYFYYLLCEGGSGINDFNISYNVNPIGMVDAARIIYYTEEYYLIPDHTFEDFRDYVLFATEALFGSGTAKLAAVQEALKAVGLQSPILAEQKFYPDPCSIEDSKQIGDIMSLGGDSYNWAFPTVQSIRRAWTNSFAEHIKYHPIGSSYTGTSSFIFEVGKNTEMIFEAGERLIFIAEHNRKDYNGNTVPNVPADSYVQFDPGPTGRIVLRICPNYSKNSSARIAENETKEPNSEKIEIKGSLSVYPNPAGAGKEFKVNYFLSKDTRVQLTIHNLQGQELHKLVDGLEQQAGDYKVEFKGKRLTPGAYFVKLVTSDPLENRAAKLIIE